MEVLGELGGGGVEEGVLDMVDAVLCCGFGM